MNTQHKKIENIYLAGKIEANGWRHEIVKELKYDTPLKSEFDEIHEGICDPWPLLKNAIFGQYHYTGPYFVLDAHENSFHGEGTHGVRLYADSSLFEGYVFSDKSQLQEQLNEPHLGHGPGSISGLPYSTILVRCTQAIHRADLVFAWIDDPTCYGTIAEIGMAYEKDKIIWIAGPRRYRDLAFVYAMADKFIIRRKTSPRDVLYDMLIDYQKHHKHFDSPIEQAFWDQWMKCYSNIQSLELVSQHPIGKYRVDFAHRETKTAIELDGFATHSSTEDIANDRRRQREIEALGWHVIRFGGKEIHNNVLGCVTETAKILHNRLSANQEQWLNQMFGPDTHYHSGDRVSHAIFGNGIVTKSEISGGAEFVEVQFQSQHGKKRLSMDFARLEKL